MEHLNNKNVYNLLSLTDIELKVCEVVDKSIYSCSTTDWTIFFALNQ